MARNFAGGSGISNFLRLNPTTGLNPSTFSATGCTFSAWGFPADTSSQWQIFADWQGMGEVGINRTTRKWFYGSNASSYDSATTATYTGWTHLAITLTSTGVFQGYRNGVADGAGLTSQTFGNFNQVTIGSDGASDGINGPVAEVACWSVNLTAAEVAALAQGRRARSIRPLSLKGYWPVDGLVLPEPDFSGQLNNVVLTGTGPLAAGPPLAMFTPRGARYELFVGAAPGVGGVGALISGNRSNLVRGGLVLS